MPSAPPFSLQSHRKLRALFERFLAVSFVVQLLDSFAFTGLLWFWIEGPREQWLTWPVIFAPLWLSNLLGVSGSIFHIIQLWHLRYPLGLAAWPDADRNLLIGAVDAVVDETASAIVKGLLLLPLGGIKVSLLLLFLPFWAAVCFQAYTFFHRHPKGKGAFLVKPRYIMATIVACRVDGLTHSSWLVQFVPVWLALGAMALVLVTALCTGMLALSMQGETSAARSTVFAVLWLIGASLTGCGFAFCERLAERLDGNKSIQAYEYMVPMLVAEASLLFGTLAISILLRKIRRQLQSEQVERERAARAAEEDILLQFVQSPDDVLVRHSSTLFRRWVGNEDSHKVAPISGIASSATATAAATAAALVSAATVADTLDTAESVGALQRAEEGTLSEQIDGVRECCGDVQDGGIEGRPIAARSLTCSNTHIPQQFDGIDDTLPPTVTSMLNGDICGNDNNDTMECVICCTCEADAVFLECGHGGVCIDCAEQISKKRPALCPICRQTISHIAQLGEQHVENNRVIVNIRKIASLVHGGPSSNDSGARLTDEAGSANVS